MTPNAKNLLARIHGDGGQHQDRVGFDQGCKDAEDRVVEMMKERDEARAALRALVESYDSCDSHRGAFSCVAAHDVRCLKARGKPEAECGCGRDELDAALERARDMLGEEEAS